MKVAVLVNELNIRGGTHKQVLRLCEYLESQNIEFELLTKYYDKEKTYPGIQKFHPKSLYHSEEEFYKKRSLTDRIKGVFRLFDMISKDCDVVNVHDNGFLWIMWLVVLKSHQKVVWQINDLPDCFKVGVGAQKSAGRKDKLMNRIYTAIAKKAAAITVNVTKNKDRVECCMGKNAEVFYCGVDVNPALQKHSYHPEIKKQIKLLSTGVFFGYRNYETLVRVVEYLRNKGYDITLDIIGSTNQDKEYASRIIDLINEKKLESAVKVWGQVDEETYNLLYNGADIFAFVNIDQSWGLTVFEAMSAGIPTIVSNSVGAIELLHNDEDAIIVEPKDVEEIAGKIVQLVNDKGYYTRISEKAYEAVKHYSWDELYSSKMVSLFERVIKK